MNTHTTTTASSISIGELLKKKREEKNISLKEAENATSIRTAFLQAIEQGELGKVISPIYAQGFLKQYAGFLGLDGDAIVKENQDLFKNIQKHEFDYGIGTLEVRDNPISGVKWLPNFVWILAFFVIMAMAWYLAKSLEVI